nr:transmembrane protein 256 homolog [Megalopta genalis]
MQYLNTLSNTLYKPIAGTASYILGTTGGVLTYVLPAPNDPIVTMKQLWELAAQRGPYVQLAALSGATAVGLGAYGAHRKYPEDKKVDQVQVFETANRYHFMHTLAILGLPLTRIPLLGAVFFMSGIILFSGTLYYYAFTGDGKYRRYAPIGGVCFIVGWLSMCI